MNNCDKVLRVLSDHGPLTSKELVDHTRLSKGAVSKAVGFLVERGEVHRSTDTHAYTLSG